MFNTFYFFYYYWVKVEIIKKKDALYYDVWLVDFSSKIVCLFLFLSNSQKLSPSLYFSLDAKCNQNFQRWRKTRLNFSNDISFWFSHFLCPFLLLPFLIQFNSLIINYSFSIYYLTILFSKLMYHFGYYIFSTKVSF